MSLKKKGFELPTDVRSEAFCIAGFRYSAGFQRNGCYIKIGDNARLKRDLGILI
jgi:hypothetical protein